MNMKLEHWITCFMVNMYRMAKIANFHYIYMYSSLINNYLKTDIDSYIVLIHT